LITTYHPLFYLRVVDSPVMDEERFQQMD
jgi:hypothetical protein